MAVTTMDGLVMALTAGETRSFLKASQTAEGAGSWHSLWKAAGYPGAGVNPGSANGVIPTDATAGAFPFTNAAGAANNYLGYIAAATSTVGTLILYDRLWHNSTLVGNVTTAQTFTQPALTRYTNGQGVELFGEVYCVDPATECLTRRAGWTVYTDIRDDDEILAYDPTTKTTRWETPSEIFSADYRGDMISLGNISLDTLSTPNHRWPTWTRPRPEGKSQFRVRTSDDLPMAGWIPRAATFEAPMSPVLSDEFVRLCGWYFTEGSLRADGKAITIVQSLTANPDNVEMIRSDLVALGAQTATAANAPKPRGWRNGSPRREGLWCRERAQCRDDDEVIHFNITGTEVDWVTRCVVGRDKVPTMDFLSALTSEQLEMFVDVCIAGDGDGRGGFVQWNDDRMDAFTVAATLAGHAPVLHSDGRGCTLLKVKRSKLSKLHRRRLYYEGPVWCPVTDSGFWVARRRGKTFITGNTAMGATGSTFTATYTDQDGTASNSATYVMPANALSVGQMFPFDLASGDYGVRSVQQIQLSASTGVAGDFGLTLLKRLVTIPLPQTNNAVVYDAFSSGLREIQDDACLAFMVQCSTTSTGQINGELTIAKG